jgi:hypothetical protein
VPALFAVLGATGAVVAATLATYRYYFLGASGVLLALGLWRTFGRTSRGSCRPIVGRARKAILLLATLLFLAATAVNLVMG